VETEAVQIMRACLTDPGGPSGYDDGPTGNFSVIGHDILPCMWFYRYSRIRRIIRDVFHFV